MADDYISNRFIVALDKWRRAERAHHAARAHERSAHVSYLHAMQAAQEACEAEAAALDDVKAANADNRELDIAPADLVVEHTGRGTFSDDYLKTGQNP